MDLDLDLHLDERADDRVVVTLAVSPPCGCAALVDEATLQLVDAQGEELCPRHLLPLSGRIAGPVTLTAELRCLGAIPEGARVLASVWAGTTRLQCGCPADPYVDLRDHLKGSRLGLPPDDAVPLSELDAAGRARLEAVLPWVAQPMRRPEVDGVLEAPEPVRTTEELQAELDLDADTASWLHDLLDQDV
jgi:hypothetical protein